jgi:hypothetical protein
VVLAALDTLAKLEPADLTTHAAAVAAKLGDPQDWVRCVALETLAKLEPGELAEFAAAIRKASEHVNPSQRGGFSQGHLAMVTHFVLHKLEPAAGHLHALAAGLDEEPTEEEDSSGNWPAVKAVEMLARLEAPELSMHATALIAKLDGFLAPSAMKALANLAPAAFAQHATSVVMKLEDPRLDVYALETLAALEPVHLRPHVAAIANAVANRPDRRSGNENRFAMVGNWPMAVVRILSRMETQALHVFMDVVAARASSAIGSVTVVDVLEIKAMMRPPMHLNAVFAACLCILHGEDVPFEAVDTTWEAAREMMSVPQAFRVKLLALKQKIDDGLVPRSNFCNIQHLLDLEHFSPAKLGSYSSMAKSLAEFIININLYNDVKLRLQVGS